MRTWGVDLSTNASNTGLVSITWEPDKPGQLTAHREVIGPHELARLIADTVGDGDHWAVDVPFGWPTGLGHFIASHGHGPAQLPAHLSISPDQLRPHEPIALRVTDRRVKARLTTINPLSVSFDKIGATAAYWAHVEWILHSHYQLTIDRSGTTGRIIETYPAAAWLAWTKDPLSTITSATLAAKLTGIVEADAWGNNSHIRDAAICALVARAHSMGGTEHAPSADIATAGAEGWIHLPVEGHQLTALI